MCDTITFSNVALQWIDAKRKFVKRSTYCAYNLILHKHLIPRFRDAATISEAMAQKMVIDLLENGLSRKTVKDILATLKAVVKYGSKYYGLSQSEWEIVFPTETSRKPLPVMSISSQRRLMHYISEYPTAQNIGILVALCSGMRIGEICALKWEDVDMQRRIITVNQTVGRIYDCDAKVTERIMSSPKTKTSNREIPICRELLTAFRIIRKQSPSAVYVLGGGMRPKEPRIYREYFSRLLKRLSIPKIVFHGLRHTFATRCVECQCDYKTISTILGHSNVSTTLNLYVHPNIEQKKRCLDRFSKFMGLKDLSGVR